MSDERIRVEVTEQIGEMTEKYAAEAINPKDAVDAIIQARKANDEYIEGDE